MAQDITARKNAEEALRVRAQELETFNRAMVGREMRLIELKEEINRLCAELGRPPAYPPVWNGVKQ
jgi:predicted  nucleic acid-binding Zn-ribbon protein